MLSLLRAELVNLILWPPWHAYEPRPEANRRVYGPQGHSKEEAARDFLAFLLIVPPGDIQVFSDGLKSESIDGSIGRGFIAY
jgi:hypothetical protein